MTNTIKVENQLQSYELVKALQDRREKATDEKTVNAIDEMLEQLDGSMAHAVLTVDEL